MVYLNRHRPSECILIEVAFFPFSFYIDSNQKTSIISFGCLSIWEYLRVGQFLNGYLPFIYMLIDTDISFPK